MGDPDWKDKLKRLLRWFNPRVVPAKDLRFLEECNQENVKNIDQLYGQIEAWKQAHRNVSAQCGTAAMACVALLMKEGRERTIIRKEEQDRALTCNLGLSKDGDSFVLIVEPKGQKVATIVPQPAAQEAPNG